LGSEPDRDVGVEPPVSTTWPPARAASASRSATMRAAPSASSAAAGAAGAPSVAAGAAAGQGGQIAVQTTCAAGKVVLKVEDAGPPVSQEQLAHLFEPSAAGRDGTSSLELAACKTITRRFAGTIRAEASREGGVTFVVEWDAAEL